LFQSGFIFDQVMMAGGHTPVLVREVIEFLKCRSGGVYIDCTVGDGGHTEAILKASEPDGRVIGLDQDLRAIEYSRGRLHIFGPRVNLHHESFVDLDAVLDREGVEKVDGILFDLGMSSAQLEEGERGFSFNKEGPLDMRMDQRRETTAEDLINQLDEAALTRIFLEYGEERWAKKISRVIIQERARSRITTTSGLVQVVVKAVPRGYQRYKIHPATRVFQALRIAVNDELTALRQGIQAAIRRLMSGARLCMISFHSLEDRIVKHDFREEQRQGRLKVITKRPVMAGAEERSVNPRSRSAKLRVAERAG
jgi:16S rRNA (cytosine1402-N4)-methyltransferase